MNIDFGFPDNIIMFTLMLVNWGIVLFFVFVYYKRLQVKPAIWKVLLVTYIGLFSFSFTLRMFETGLKLAILPLGVWILYGFLKNKNWGSYRKFAWLGFLSNYLFLACTLLSVVLHNGIYPKDEMSTYIAKVDHAAIIAIHPTAPDAKFDKAVFQSRLKEVQLAESDVIEWYHLPQDQSSDDYQKERFPYLLIGIESRWGSGLKSAIYIQDDGKGLLIATSNRQYYFRSEQPLMEVGVHN